MSDTGKPEQPGDGAQPPERPDPPGTGEERGQGGDGWFEVNLPQLQAHSRGTATLAGKVGTAGDASRQVASYGFDMAYGAILRFFPLMVLQVEVNLLKAIDGGMRVLEFAADQLEESGEDYRRMDETGADNFNGIGGELR